MPATKSRIELACREFGNSKSLLNSVKGDKVRVIVKAIHVLLIKE